MTCESSVRGRVGFVRRLLSARGMTACRWMSRRSPLRSARARWRSLLDRGLASPEVSRHPGALDWPDPLTSAGPLLGWRPQDDALAALQILDRGEITPDHTARFLGRRHGPHAIHADHLLFACHHSSTRSSAGIWAVMDGKPHGWNVRVGPLNPVPLV